MRTQLHHLVAEAAVTRGDAPAVTVKDTTRTYAQLWAESVAVYLDKRVETVTAIFGASAAGGVFVPVNPLLRARQVAFILADCDVKVLVTTPERLATLRAELGGCKALEH